MLTWLLLGAALYLLTAYVPSILFLRGVGLGAYLGSRDDEPLQGPLHGRALRAARNFGENFPVFAMLGVLALIVPEVDMDMATTGAMIFVLARLVYLPLYLMAVKLVRSVIFMVGWVGMIMMAVALL